MNYQRLLEQLRLHEGLRLSAYLCPAGYWTIGYGRNLESVGLSDSEQQMLFGEVLDRVGYIERLKDNPITQAQADELLLNDLARVERDLSRYLNLELFNAPRQAVCLNMAYNIGVSGFLRFHRAIAAMQSGHWEDAAHELLDSRWAMQVGRRAKELAEQTRTGEWQ